MKSIRQILLKEPGNFLKKSIEFNDEIRADEALLRVHRVGLCGTDQNAFKGKQAFFSYPRVLGHELGVEVLDVGAEVKHIKTGDHCSVEPYISTSIDQAYLRGKTNCSASTECLGVHQDGAMQDLFILPAKYCHPSDLLSYDALALVEMLGIGKHAVDRAALIGDEEVAVIGLGPIGLTILQFLAIKGVPCIGIDIQEQRIKGAAKLFPHIQLKKITPETDLKTYFNEHSLKLPEVVFDATGNKASMEASFHLPTNGGRIILVGIHNGDLTFNHPALFRPELSIITSRNSVAKDFKQIIRYMEAGFISPETWISHRCKADELPQKINDWLSPDSGLIKGIIEFS